MSIAPPVPTWAGLSFWCWPYRFKKMASSAYLASERDREYLGPMNRIFDMDDRARLPWRFYGARRSVRAGL